MGENSTNSDLICIKQENEEEEYHQVFLKEERPQHIIFENENEFRNEKHNPLSLIADTKKKYACTFTSCDAHFSRPSRLKRHIRQHTGEVKNNNKIYIN